MKRGMAALLLLTIVAALPAYAQAPQAKPNFSGTWIFSPQRSALKVPAPNSMTLKIAQNDPSVSFSRTQAYGDQSYTWQLEIVADGQKEVVQDSTAYSTRSRAYWQ